ncbi:MAG TPA: hypothetical protein VMA83_01185 [Solirubrobacteraceae bacterium]|nr:hypothetical protein [Solirubrobacteraceae bacterium]
MCTRHNVWLREKGSEVDSIKAEVEGKPSLGEALHALGRLTRLLRALAWSRVHFAGALLRIPHPESDRSWLSRWYWTQLEVVQAEKEGATAIEDLNTRGFDEAWNEALRHLSFAHRLARAHGLRVCGKHEAHRMLVS